MARTDKYPGQGIAKTGLITGKQSIYETSTTRRHAIGQRMCMGDGRVFYYARNSTAASARPGVLFAADIDRAEEDTTITEAIGDKTMASFTTVGSLGPAAVGGYFWSSSGTGAGQTYKIADVTAAASTTSNIHLHDELVATLTGADCNIANNPFYGVQLSADGIQFLLGVALLAIPASAYFWLQTWGFVGVLRGDALGDLATERELHCHGSGTTTLSTDAGALGRQTIGHNTLFSTNVVDADWYLANLTIWP